METVNLKTSITTLLTAVHPRVYEYTRVPQKAQFPYVTYNLPNSLESERANDEDVILTIEVDVMDYRKDRNTDTLETLFDAINNAINRVEVDTEPNFYYRIDRTNLLTQLPTPNEFTFRRQFVGELHYNERSI